MHIFTKRDSSTNQILTVETEGCYQGKSEQDMLDAVARFNETHESEYYEALEVDDKAAEVVSFLLGKDKYRLNKTITELLDALSSLRSDINKIYDAVDDVRDRVLDMQSK